MPKQYSDQLRPGVILESYDPHEICARLVTDWDATPSHINARQWQALRSRIRDNIPYKQIGAALGVSPTQARQLVGEAARRLCYDPAHFNNAHN